ncbi:MAG: flagellar brake protein [Leptothrix sp. (in: Bacteria)]|nr:flagellar brake protein [Leptothrix sp. (in: b-proteobacteria)]
MFDDTRPAELDSSGSSDPWSEFRVAQPQERLELLRALRDGGVPVVLNTPDGTSMTVTLWTLDAEQGRINLSVDAAAPQLQPLVEADETVAVAYLESVKLQFDLQDFMLVHGTGSSALQCRLPEEIYRFQRRNAYRVRTRGKHGPQARFRHPSMPEMLIELRVLDISIGGCALWLPPDVPPLQAGTLVAEVHIELDADTRLTSAVGLQHVAAQGPFHGSPGGNGTQGVRLGCEWRELPPAAERVLQRWIDRTQRRRHLLTLS